MNLLTERGPIHVTPLLVYSEGVAGVDGMGEISPQTDVVSAAVRGGVVEVEVVGEGAAQGKFCFYFPSIFIILEASVTANIWVITSSTSG